MKWDRETNCCIFMRENPDNRVRLFCFHHAGGSAVLFADWYKYLIPAVGIYPMQMKRRTADSSAPFHSIREAAETFAAWIRHYSDRPVYFFGHSMGGVLAFCTAEILERQYGIRAVRLFASASVPDLGVRGADAKSRISELPDPLFLEFLKDAGGVDGKTLAWSSGRSPRNVLYRSSGSAAGFLSPRQKMIRCGKPQNMRNE